MLPAGYVLAKVYPRLQNDLASKSITIAYFLLIFEKFFHPFFSLDQLFYRDFPNYSRAFAESRTKKQSNLFQAKVPFFIFITPADLNSFMTEIPII